LYSEEDILKNNEIFEKERREKKEGRNVKREVRRRRRRNNIRWMEGMDTRPRDILGRKNRNG